MGSPALLYWASALAEQEAARIRAECSNVTDGPGGVQSLTLFSPHFSSCSPPLMCAFKPSCLLQLNVHFIFCPLLSPHHVVPIMVSYIFPLNHQRVCVRCVGTWASTHISAETQSVQRPECPSWLCALDRRGLKCVFSFFFSWLFFRHTLWAVTLVRPTPYIILFLVTSEEHFWLHLDRNIVQLVLRGHVLCERTKEHWQCCETVREWTLNIWLYFADLLRKARPSESLIFSLDCQLK